jgi:hypothetical protein
MGYRLGVDLGTSFTAATIGRAGSTQGASLGVDSAIVPSVVYIGANGERLYGTAAAELAGAEPGRVLRGFVRRIGDETPMVPEAGASTAAHRVTADFVAWVVAQASVQEGRAPEAVAVTHPATWGPHKRDLLAVALREAGVPGATLVAAPVAVATAGAGRTHAAGTVVAVYDLGGRTFDAALVRRETSGAWTSIGRPAGLPDLGGADLDDLVLAHVVAGLTPDQQQAMAQLDAEDEATAAALAGLRAACVQAKEALSADTVTTVEVKLPGISTKIRLTRSEFETMINAAVEGTVDVLDSVLDSAGLVAADVDCILVSGGSSRIPLVTQLLSRQFQLPVLRAGGDKSASANATGAVLALAHLAPAPVEPTVPAARPAVKTVKITRNPAKAARNVAGTAPAVPAPAKRVAPVEPAAPVAPAAPAAPAPVASAPAASAPAASAPAASAPVASGPAVELPLPTSSGPTSKPIRPHRPGRRAEIVGLEGLAPVARSAEAPALDGPRAVIAPRAVRSVDALLVQERVRTPRIEDQVPPPRPALDDTGFELVAETEIEQLQAGWTWRSVFSIRRSLALTVLTGAIYVGSTAWIPATPAITEAPSPTLHVASATP